MAATRGADDGGGSVRVRVPAEREDRALSAMRGAVVTRLLVAGAGALGSVFGGFLRLAGYDVTLLGRPAHLEAIARHGLAIGGLWGEHVATGFGLVTEAGSLAGRFDCVLLCVKSFDTANAIAAVAPVLDPDGVVIALQNGLGNLETIAGVVGAQRTLGARVIFGAELPAPGRVRVTVYADEVLFGALRPTAFPALDAHGQAWAARCTAAGIPTAWCADIAAALWGKVLYNGALNPLGALLGVHYGALADDAHTRAIMDAVIAETFAVAVAERVRLPWASAAAYRETFYGRLVPPTYHHRSSMLQDLERGRLTEIDAINGYVWRRGQARGVDTRANELLTRLVHAREALGSGGVR